MPKSFGALRLIGLIALLAIAVSAGWCASMWRNARDASIVMIGNREKPAAKQTVAAAPRDNIEIGLASLKQELAELRAEQQRHMKALKGIIGHIAIEERIAKYGESERPVREASDSTSEGLYEILSGDPHDPSTDVP